MFVYVRIACRFFVSLFLAVIVKINLPNFLKFKSGPISDKSIDADKSQHKASFSAIHTV